MSSYQVRLKNGYQTSDKLQVFVSNPAARNNASRKQCLICGRVYESVGDWRILPILFSKLHVMGKIWSHSGTISTQDFIAHCRFVVRRLLMSTWRLRSWTAWRLLKRPFSANEFKAPAEDAVTDRSFRARRMWQLGRNYIVEFSLKGSYQSWKMENPSTGDALRQAQGPYRVG